MNTGEYIILTIHGFMDGVFSDRLAPILEPGCNRPGIPGKKRGTRSQHGAYGVPPMTRPHHQWTTREASKWAMWQYSHPYLVAQSFTFLDGRVAVPGKCGFKRGELGVCDLYTSSATLLSKQCCLWVGGRDLGVGACGGGARLAGKRGGGRRTVCEELDG